MRTAAVLCPHAMETMIARAKPDAKECELRAAAAAGYTAQIGSPITIGPPTDMVPKFWEEITLPGHKKTVAEIIPDGRFGIFLGHTFIVNETGHEVVDNFPLEIAVA